MVDAMQIKFGTFCHDSQSIYKFNKSEVSIANKIFDHYLKLNLTSESEFGASGLLWNTFRQMMLD